MAFATRAVDAPHRIETPARLLFRGIPVRAVRVSRPTRRSTLTVPDSSHGVHRSPLRRHDGRCVHTRLGRRPDFGPGLPHPERVPFLPFLPASTVSSAEGESEDSPLRLPAGLLHPAAGHGVHHVSDSLVRPLDRTRPGGRGPEGPGESSPVANTLRSVPLLDSLHHAVTARRPFGLGRVHRLACPPAVSSRARYRVATLRCSARRPQGFLPSRSPLRSRDVSAARPLDAPLGFGSTRSRCCHAFRVAQPGAGRFALRPNRFGVPDPNVEGRQDVSALSGSVRPKGRPSPKGGLRTVAVAPAPPEGGTSAASLLGPEGIGGMPVDPPGGGSTASVRAPEGTWLPT